MLKILVVKYLPRGDRSNTKALLDAFLDAVRGKAQLEELDLGLELPDFFTPERLAAYLERDYGGKKLGPEQAAEMAKMDRMTEQLRRNDAVVLATPMQNFTLPAPVKAWFDSVMLKGKTWDLGAKGYLGLMKGKRALVLYSSGGVYAGSSWAAYDHLTELAKVEFGFMGYETEVIGAQGMNALSAEQAEAAVKAAAAKARTAAAKWV